MKLKAVILILTVFCIGAAADPKDEVKMLAEANGLHATERNISAIVYASNYYRINVSELTAIAIIETGLGKNVKPRHNSNGTIDTGLFQINTINQPKCIEYNLDSPEGSALCAAKLLYNIKKSRKDYLGVYHSKTPSRKIPYLKRVNEILAMNVK
jgi:hypothetical protein